jgi:glycosyltransferase involved in cell wall biosynthesis
MRVAVIPLKGKLELQRDFQELGVSVFHEIASYSLLRQILACNKIASGSRNVHCHLPRAELIGALVSHAAKLVISRHNTEPFFPGAPKYASILLSRMVSSRAGGFIAISEAVKQYLIDSREIPERLNTQVILYGVDERFAERANPLAHVEAGILNRAQEADLVVTTIGRLTEQKDYPTILSAFEEICKSNQKALLLIIGEGEMDEQLKALAIKLGISGNISWIGKTPNVASYLAISDVFILASKYEGFGLVLLEAMSLNVPIVGSDNSAIREVLTSEHPGLVRTGDYGNFARRVLSAQNDPLRLLILELQSKRLNDFSPRIMENLVYRMYNHDTLHS